MNESPSRSAKGWPEHVIRAGTHFKSFDDPPDPDGHRDHVEPWLSALFQAEHLNLLVGSGLTTAVALAGESQGVDMATETFSEKYAGAVDAAANEVAERLGRGDANIEDQVRTIRELIAGLQILALTEEGDGDGPSLPERASKLAESWETALDDALRAFVQRVLGTESGIEDALVDDSARERADRVRRLVSGFLLPFASRSATRERLHIFTTNYDRVLEYGCDLLGLRVVDRFVGTLAPVFHSSRLGVDLHYNPPGIRGEPRYLEGVVRLTKLHGSVDWVRLEGPSGVPEIRRTGLPFGAEIDHPGLPARMGDSLLIYPNPAKDVETLEYPYAELFRDFAAAACQPNSVLVTYGYGFGDDHVNRILRDMLSIPSTHLVIISYDDAGGRLWRFYERMGRDAQITLLVGPHFGGLDHLVDHYLPKPAIDRATWRMVDLLQRRTPPQPDGPTDPEANRPSDGIDS